MYEIEGPFSVPYFDGSVQRGGSKKAGSVGRVSGEVGDRLIRESGDFGFMCDDGVESIRRVDEAKDRCFFRSEGDSVGAGIVAYVSPILLGHLLGANVQGDDVLVFEER